MIQPGVFITLEGVEGAGKSTAMALLGRALEEAGIRYISTREPGGTALGEQLRALLLHTDGPPIQPMSELLMMFAARAQHLADVIRPALEDGKWVICDRFTDASYAYQGGGRGLDERCIATLEDLVQGERRPDVTVLLDIPVDVGLARARGRGTLDRFEREELDFFERVRRAYLRRAERHNARYRIIDAELSLDQVERALRRVVHEFQGDSAVACFD